MTPTITDHPPTALFRHGEFRAEWHREPGAARARCEAELLAAGLSLPLPHRSAWAEFRRPAGSWFAAIRDAGGVTRAGFAVEVVRSRALPGHQILRAERFGRDWPPDVREVCVAALERLARASRVLRLHVELFVPEEPAQAALAAALAARGFQPAAAPRRYRQTLRLDLRRSDDEILRSFDSSTRRLIRIISKYPLAVRPIESPEWTGRMADIHQETMTRTGAVARLTDWGRGIEFARTYPDLARLVGLFRTDVHGPDALLAYASAYRHGDYAHYDAAGSTRRTDLKLSLGYPLIWDLLVWANRHGAGWFDFGGVTQGRHGTADRLGGISDFKRNFTDTVVTVGGEWILEPRPARARVAGLVSAGAAWWSRLRAARPAPMETIVP